MKRFAALFLAVLFATEFFLFCGGYYIFDFSRHIYLAGGAWALMISIVVYAFVMQYEQIEALKKRVQMLEEQRKE